MKQVSVVSDLHVTPLSDALAGCQIDVVVSGSIAAVESVRFIRALRRLGAEVTPWLTQGGSQFITPMALEWASSKPCVQAFSGTATHICTSDAVLVAPASANIIQHIATGSTATPSSALISSALGQNKPVFLLPAMHDSLAQAPSHIHNLKTLAQWPSVKILPSRLEEGKRKFPDPATLADQAAHLLNSARRPQEPVLLTMGTTRGYIDDVRYISNYSSGKLGTMIAEELYRQGFATRVVSGPCEFQPLLFTSKEPIKTTSEMLDACLKASATGLTAGIFCASVLDFEPTEKLHGKIKSSAASLQVNLKPTEKIIGRVNLTGKPKIGFKLEVDLDLEKATQVARDYITKYDLAGLIVNDLRRVSATEHHAWAISKDGSVTECLDKRAVAAWIVSRLSPER